MGDGVVRTASDPYTVDHFFRVLFGILAPRHDAVMVHACGVITNIPWNRIAGCGKVSTAPAASIRPRAAIVEQSVVGRELVSPTARTARAVTVTTISGKASLTRRR